MNNKEQHATTIQSLNELVAALSEGERTDFTEIVQSINIPTTEFETFCSWSSECYTRNCLVENEEFELILICWEKEQFTPIHGHNGEECWVKFIQGEFKETIFKLNEEGALKEMKSSLAKAGENSYMIDFMGYHRLENLDNTRSMSLHLYAKPIRNCQLFDEDLAKFVSKELTYDTVSELMTK